MADCVRDSILKYKKTGDVVTKNKGYYSSDYSASPGASPPSPIVLFVASVNKGPNVPSV